MRERTVADLYRELSGQRFTADNLRDLFTWPPDVFAMTSELLRISGAYRAVVSPPEGRTWPAQGPAWRDRVAGFSAKWIAQLASLDGDANRPLQPPIDRYAELLWANRRKRVRTFLQQDRWDEVTAVLTLHAIADESCAGMPYREHARQTGLALDAAYNMTLRRTLARFPEDRIVVLPKGHCPEPGISIRNLSYHVCALRSEVEIRFVRAPGAQPEGNLGLRLLLFPWPFEVGPEDFKAVPSRLRTGHEERYGYFRFAPRNGKEELERLRECLQETLSDARRYGDVDAVVMPECALTEEGLESVAGALHLVDRGPDKPDGESPWTGDDAPAVRLLLAGVQTARANRAVLRIPRVYKVEDYHQDKHHRWLLNGTQIHTYDLADRLHPGIRYWEDMEVGPRRLTMVSFGPRVSMCYLICEDLARLDPVSAAVRTLGPSLVIALLLDGPQLPQRWPARYAMVLADDPGSSVLTLTSLGMALRSRPPNTAESRSVALWQDPRHGMTALDLESGRAGLLLTLWAEDDDEHTMDGRVHKGAASRLVLGRVRGVGKIPARRPT
ncbi:MAG: hypothetical protein ACFCGT_26305 [Sandaracinaceae bacterium]